MDIDLILQDNDERLTYEDLVKIKEAIEALGFYVNAVPTVKRFLSVQEDPEVRMIRICDECDEAFPEEEFEEIEDGVIWHFPYDTGKVGHAADHD
jgi:hypothetical protein